jgi:uncharacterized protein YggU (UPF0235/DUF167 family)
MILLVGALSLTGCGGGDDDGAPAPTVIGTLDPAILNAGGYYFQVHTQTNGGGELRTNITVPAGSTGTVTFDTTLTAAPGVTTAATGIASLTVNVSTGEVTGASITASNLSSPVVGAHIHNPAPAGQANGAVVIDLSSRINATVAPAPTVIGTLDPAILNAGGYYFQVHTQTNGGGELRTNITVPAGSTGTVTFNTTLTAAPGVITAGTGTASLTVNVGTGAVTGASITVSNLSSPIAGAHIHNPAPAGQANGAIVIDLSTRVTVN